LRLLLAVQRQWAGNQQVLDFLTFAQQRNIDPGRLWLAEQNGKLLWAVLPIPGAGRTMLLFPPNDPPRPGVITQAAGMLIDAVCDSYAAPNIQLAQVLLDPGDGASRRLFDSHGFARMAELIYLQAAARRSAAAPAPPPGFALSTYSVRTHALFAGVIVASYRDSLDCPGLNGVRDIEDVIAGHKASGEFDPNYWFVLCERDAAGDEQPRGVLLLSRMQHTDAAELVYLGVAADSRGKKLGEWLMRQAFAAVASMGVSRISLAVDSANAPALQLYYRFGLARIGSKIALMRRLDQPRQDKETTEALKHGGAFDF